MGHSAYDKEDGAKPCRVCTDFGKAMKKTSKVAVEVDTTRCDTIAISSTGCVVVQKAKEPEVDPYRACPPDGGELGRASWTLLHTLAAYYPEKPSTEHRTHATNFFGALSRCDVETTHAHAHSLTRTCKRVDCTRATIAPIICATTWRRIRPRRKIVGV